MAKKNKHGRGRQAMQNDAWPGQYGQPPNAQYGPNGQYGPQYGQYGQQYGAPPWGQYGMASGLPGGMEAGFAQGFAQGMGPLPQQAAADGGFLQNMPAFLRTGNTEQFLLGALIGAAAAWVLSDEELRGKIVKSAMKLYSGVAGGFEEMKEQMADIRAEVDAERHGDA
ncbi:MULTISPECIES: hypothetical protein [unclassified Thauera]|uniref:hypothetical protein n=1 Tax=unclassified Thauera TaxID=2609274 RepID=UPI0021E181E8|nr:hypothetical protein [Thauera sp. Sel9]MCV2217339.1 hypothetical protein [Thauera sp. Sel9]